MKDEEVKGLQVIAHALRENPQSYTLLHVQCDFLRSKGRTEWAAKLARQAVNCAPSEFATWAKLTEVYIALGMFESVSNHSMLEGSSGAPMIDSMILMLDC